MTRKLSSGLKLLYSGVNCHRSLCRFLRTTVSRRDARIGMVYVWFALLRARGNAVV